MRAAGATGCETTNSAAIGYNSDSAAVADDDDDRGEEDDDDDNGEGQEHTRTRYTYTMKCEIAVYLFLTRTANITRLVYTPIISPARPSRRHDVNSRGILLDFGLKLGNRSNIDSIYSGDSIREMRLGKYF